jgi:peroxiredoxin
MSKSGTQSLDSGDVFPGLRLNTIDGGKIETGHWLKGSFSIVLFYRGSWCPFCKTQLKSFQSGLSRLSEEGIKVLAVSVDSLEKAKETQRETGATFPIAYGVPAKETAAVIGAFYDATPVHTPPYIHSTGFVIAPDGKVIVSVYSSGAIGRLAWQDVLGLVQYIKKL